jgi:acetoin utilization deacetylase AcuC-like enzyme
MTALWITHPTCAQHEMGDFHPEAPARLHAIEERMLASGLAHRFVHEQATPAPREALLRVHDAALVDRVLKTRPAHGYVRLDPDTAMNAHTAEAAQLAAGAALRAAEAVLADEATFAFCAVRPPGHHAERARSMGFCVFNNIAVAAARALDAGLSRLAILDFDVHYGNGTSDIFRDDPRVLVCQTYQDPLYPYWQVEHGLAHVVDVPLPPGAGGAEFRDAVRRRWRPRIEAHEPELILVSAGFDAHVDDPLAGLCLRTDDFGWIGAWIHELAGRHCGGRVVATLEGGYALEALAHSVEAFVRPFVG